MGRIQLCFVWHMHQPFYKDLVSGEYKLPWTRMHALKDYYGMVKVLEDFPDVHQTFNLVPSMMVQLEEYVSGTAADPFLRCALKPAEELSHQEQNFILQYFFQANVSRMIYRYPRYGQLYEASKQLRRTFSAQDFRDLQVLSQLAWFDEEFLKGDRDVRDLIRKGRNYTLEEQRLMGRKQREIMAKVLPVYKEFASRGQIEISATPYYHPILPLLCDSDIASVSHHGVPLPQRFRYPEDARHQLVKAREYMETTFGIAPVGLWPSEGSVSDEAMRIAADVGYQWFATDNGVLGRTLGSTAGAFETYRPYKWKSEGREMHCIFRDHYLSDLIGFEYSRMGAADAAQHFLDRIRENCGGRDAVVPIILDGENAWEYYEEGGREFLRQLYKRISDASDLQALSVSEALAQNGAHEIGHIFPGSWIGANFDVWIGAEEDNQAWNLLLRAREAYEAGKDNVSPAAKAMAFEEILIAQGSDWCWWYGPEHDSANRVEFDQLFRGHLANVYKSLELQPPEELSRTLLHLTVTDLHDKPTGRIKPTIDGMVSSYFEWLGSGNYRLEERSGAMHSQRNIIQSLSYGTDGQHLFLRLDFHELPVAASLELHLKTESVELEITSSRFCLERILEAAFPLRELGVQPGDPVRFQLSVWKEKLPVAAVPQQGWLEMDTNEPGDWPA